MIRIDIATDIAQLGIWDQSRSTQPLTHLSGGQLACEISNDIDSGHVHLVNLPGQWEGTADIYIDEEIAPKVEEILIPAQGDYLLAAPSGQVVVGGAEHYRSSGEKCTTDSNVFNVPPGDYRINCYRLKDDFDMDHDSDAAIAAAVGTENYAYFQKRNSESLYSCFVPLLIIPLWYLMGFVAAFAITVSIFMCVFYIHEWLLKQDPKYLEINHAIEVAHLSEGKNIPSDISFQLSRLEGNHRMQGGTVDLN